MGVVCAAICVLLAGIWLSAPQRRRRSEPAAVSAPAQRARHGRPCFRVALDPRAGGAGAGGEPAHGARRRQRSAALRPSACLDPRDADARAGVAEVHERLCSRAENALLEERLDEAAADLEAARKAGSTSGVAHLATELAKARSR